MTLDGTFSKIILSAIILFISCIVCYVFPYLSTMAYLGCMFASVIICLVLYCRPHTAPWIAPFFPIGEGILLGIFSRFGKEDDLLGQAIFTNFAVIALMLSVYRLGIIKKRNRLLSAFILVTLGVALIYIIDMMVHLFTGCSLCFVKYEPVSIIASLVICGIVAYNLLRDFELITSGVAARAPKFMEWYCAFGVMVTILWLLSVADRRSDSESS